MSITIKPAKKKAKKAATGGAAGAEGDGAAFVYGSETAQATFEFYDAKASDAPHMRRYLQDYITSPSFDSWDLAELLTKVRVGSLCKAEDEPDGECFVFMSAVGVSQHGHLPCVKSILDFLTTSQQGMPAAITEALTVTKPAAGGGGGGGGSKKGGGGDNVGLIIKERMPHIPDAVLPGLHTAFSEDMAWIVKQKDGGAGYDYNKFVVLSKAYVDVDASRGRQDDDGDGAGGGGGKKKKKKKTKHSSPGALSGDDLVFVHPEDAVYHGFAEAVHTFPCTACLVYKKSRAPAIEGREDGGGEGGSKGKGGSEGGMVLVDADEEVNSKRSAHLGELRYVVMVLSKDAFSQCCDAIKVWAS
jgi:hypothetical protein